MSSIRLKNLQKGFTLIELLVVIGILAVLLAITLIAINPARQFAQANDTKRRSDVLSILNAIDQYAAENKGVLPPGIKASDNTGQTDLTLCTAGNPCLLSSDPASPAQRIDLCPTLVTQYIAQMPSDPKNGTPAGAVPTTTCKSGTNPSGAYNTKYQVYVGSDSRVTVSATPEIAPSISVTR